jgi:hypothetical protein
MRKKNSDHTEPRHSCEPFNRKRRFFVSVSLALIAYYGLQVQVHDAAVVSGVSMRIGRPDAIIKGLWLIWGWALWRYVQILYDYKPIWLPEIIRDRNIQREKILMRHARREILKDPQIQKKGKVTVFAITKIDPGTEIYPEIKKPGHWKYGYSVKGYSNNDSTKEISLGGSQKDLKLNQFESFLVETEAWLRAALIYPSFADYFMPALLALLTLSAPWLLA